MDHREENIKHWKKFLHSEVLSSRKVGAESGQAHKSKPGSSFAAESEAGDYDYD